MFHPKQCNRETQALEALRFLLFVYIAHKTNSMTSKYPISTNAHNAIVKKATVSNADELLKKRIARHSAAMQYLYLREQEDITRFTTT